MTKRILTAAVLGVALMCNTGCGSNDGFKKINGMSYKIVRDKPGKNAKIGDIVEYNISARVDTLPGKALVLIDSKEAGKPKIDRVDSARQVGDFHAVLPMMSVGDSVVIEVSCDTILKTVPPQAMGNLPKWLKKGNKINITIGLVSIKSMEEFQKDQKDKQAKMQEDMKAHAAQQMPVDDKTLQDYFAKNNIKAQKTASGLYYTIQKPGTGAAITEGEIVSMKYTGKTLDGKTFDSNVDTSVSHHSEPLVFPVGKHQMIPGVDEGVGLLKKGAKATLYLPSPLGYGEQAPPNIGANAILVFDVEITEVKPASMGADMPTPPQQQ